MTVLDNTYVVSLLNIVAGVGQMIFLPLFISTFTTTDCSDKIETGVYFILFMMSISFSVIFGLGSVYDYYHNHLDVAMMKQFPDVLIKIGVVNAFGGILVVFASSLGRTDGALQAILTQLLIPAMFLLSKLLVGRSAERQQLGAMALVLIGVLVGIIPSFLSIGRSTNIVYPLMFAAAAFPNAYIQVTQHKVFDKVPNYSINWLLFVVSFFSAITIICLFWMDLIPYLGTSNSIQEFGDNFAFGFSCFFDPYSNGGRCYYAFPMGVGLCVSYCSTYYLQSKLVQLASANYSALVTAICPGVAIILWVSAQTMSEWGCGSTYTQLQIILSCVSIPFLISGAYLYKETSSEDLAASTSLLSNPVNSYWMIISILLQSIQNYCNTDNLFRLFNG